MFSRAIVATVLGRRVSVAVVGRARRAFSTSADRPKPLTPDQVRRIGERDAELRKHHLELNLDFSDSAISSSADEVRRKRLIYRSKQRGWLEVDLLLGSWAMQHMHTLTHQQMDQYEKVLNQETIDIYNIVTKQMPPPEGVDSPVLVMLQEYASSKPLGTNKETYAAKKAQANLT